MSIFSINGINRTDSEIKELTAELFPFPVRSINRIKGGANNRVSCLEVDHIKKYILKEYFVNGFDERARLDVEYTALSFLWDKGIRNIPQPLNINRDRQLAVYSYIQGQEVKNDGITQKDIDDAVDFLVDINALRMQADTSGISSASEACFSGKALFQNILSRLNRLYDTNRELEGREELRSFLMSGIKPFLNIIREWSCRKSTQAHIHFDQDIPREHRILSPSDFGFHNALRSVDGEMVFLDFEYFGWDDPAKTVCDFILHPAMKLSDDVKVYFIKRFLTAFSENAGLFKRIECFYPLFGLKWCLILLNEFYPGDFSRREHASVTGLDSEAVRKEQLLKSRNMLRRIQETYQNFPYKE